MPWSEPCSWGFRPKTQQDYGGVRRTHHVMARTAAKGRPRTARGAARAQTPAGEPAEQPSLEDVVQNLGPNVARVVVAPRGLGVPVADPVIYDAIERPVIPPDALVLAIGTRPGTPEAGRLIKTASAEKAAAVIFKDGDEIATIAGEAESAGVAVVAVPDEMTWTQLHTLLINAVRFGGHSPAAGGMGGVPMGDLFALANAIAAMVGGAVTIEDPHRRVVGYSALEGQPIDEGRRLAILGRQVPELPGMRELYRMVWSSDGVMLADRATLKRLLGAGPAEMQNLQPRAAVAVRAGNEINGSIWVVRQTPFRDEQVRARGEAAPLAVPHTRQAG